MGYCELLQLRFRDQWNRSSLSDETVGILKKKEPCFNSSLALGLFANMFSVELSVIFAVVCGLLPFDTGKCWNQAIHIQEGAWANLTLKLFFAFMMSNDDWICFSLECPGFFFLLNRYALTSKSTMDIAWIRKSAWIRLLSKKNNVDKLRRKLCHFFSRRGLPLPSPTYHDVLYNFIKADNIFL